jgi:hypothetical protein
MQGTLIQMTRVCPITPSACARLSHEAESPRAIESSQEYMCLCARVSICVSVPVFHVYIYVSLCPYMCLFARVSLSRNVSPPRSTLENLATLVAALRETKISLSKLPVWALSRVRH